MAVTPDQIAELRDMLGETDDPSLFTDDQLETWITRGPTMYHAAVFGWRSKMAHFANLTDITDGASQRKFSTLMANAQTMVDMYTKWAYGPGPRGRVGRIRRNMRPWIGVD